MKTERIGTRDLLLDPGNPRFAHSIQLEDRPDDGDVIGLQKQTLARFSMQESSSGDGDVFYVKELCDSMRQIGFVPVDRPVVRSLAGAKGKFLVIEGNRRLASAKLLIEQDDAEANADRRLSPNIRRSLERVEVLILPRAEDDPDEIDRAATVILGLRHHGSVLEWSALPKAFSLYTEYMGVEPRLVAYVYERQRAVKVGNRFSVKPADVRKGCEAYIAYSQLSKAYSSVRPRHYSLIQELATNRSLTGKAGFFVADPATGLIEEESLARMHVLCEFADRDRTGAQNIIPRPQDVRHLARLVKESKTNENESVREYAKGLLAEIESGGPPEERAVKDVESAALLVKNFINQKQWASRLIALLDKQAEELRVEDYTPSDNALLYKEDVERTFSQLRRVLGV